MESTWPLAGSQSMVVRDSRLRPLGERYGTGSGSDMALARAATYESTRSLPLPVPYQSPAVSVILSREDAHVAERIADAIVSLRLCEVAEQSPRRDVMRDILRVESGTSFTMCDARSSAALLVFLLIRANSFIHAPIK